MLRMIFVDRDKECRDVLRWQFRSHPEVEIVCGRFEDLPSFDCVASTIAVSIRSFSPCPPRIRVRTLQQYVGRLHRLHAGKTEVRFHDYIGAVPGEF